MPETRRLYRQTFAMTGGALVTDAVTQRDLDAQWTRIEAWYAKRDAAHLLRPGAGDDDLLKVERRLGVTLPEPMRASLRRHNGSHDEGWATGTLLSCGAVIAATELWRRTAEKGEGVRADFTCPDAERGVLQPGWWHRGWIAIDEDPFGNATAVDTAPGAHGRHGQILEMDHLTGPIHSSGGVVEYLGEVADALAGMRVIDGGAGLVLEEADVWLGDSRMRANRR